MSDLPVIPFERQDALEVPAAYRELRAEKGITRVRTRVGDAIWLVSGYQDARNLCPGPRLALSHPEPEKAARVSGSALLGGPLGESATEKANNERMRRLLMPSFSATRLKDLR